MTRRNASGVVMYMRRLTLCCARAAERGGAASQNKLGLMYYYSHGVERDYAEALKWWRLSADGGFFWGKILAFLGDLAQFEFNA